MSHAYPPRAGQRAQPSPLRADPDSLSADRHSPPPSVAQTHSDTTQTLGGESRPTQYLAGEKARPGSEERAKSEPSTTSDRDRKRVGQEGTAGDAPTQAQSQPPYTIYSETMRWSIVGLVSLAGLFSPLTGNIFFPVIPAIASDLGVTVELINISVLCYMIAQGVAPSFAGAVCDVLGRRPVYIASFIIYIGASAGLANTHAYWLLVVLRVLQAAGSAPVIAIGAGSIGDIAPPSERGLFMSIFGLGPMLGPCIGPIVGGVLADRFGWQALFWFLLVLGALVLLLIVLFLPETLRSLVGNGSIAARGLNRSLVSIWQQRQLARKNRQAGVVEPDAASLAAKPPRKGWADVKPFAPLKMFREKDVLVLLAFNSACYTLFYTVITSTGTTFKNTYGLNETELGLCFIANGAGCLFATLVNGPRLTHDYNVVKRQVERKKREDSSEPDGGKEGERDHNDLSTFPIEHARLRSEPYFFCALIGSTIAYGWLLDKGVHLSAPLIMQFIIGLSVTTIFNCTSTLLVDLYPGQSASATAANNLSRCLLGAAGVSFIEPLINKLGAGWSFTFLSLLNCCFAPLVLVDWKYGMRWRAERAERVERAKERKAARDAEAGRQLEQAHAKTQKTNTDP